MSNRIRLLVTDEALYVANTGRPIDRRGVISIARQYLSAKGETPPEDIFRCSDRELVDAIREKRLSLYREEPNDLKEHASQELQTRRDYAGRALWELLQNADDAMAPEGRPSNELIGAKGLGFKSVLEITDRPEIHSGAFHFCFDPDLSRALLLEVTGDPPRLVFRLPHPKKADAQVKKMRMAGFTTVVKLPFKDEASRKMTEDRLATLPHHFMLLSQHLRHFEAQFRNGTIRQFSRQGGELDVDAARAILKISENGHVQTEEWRVWSRVWPAPAGTEKRLSAAIAIQVNGKSGLPTADELPFHVFYPTQESVLAPFLVHASMELRSDRNHLLSGAHDAELLSALGELAAAAAAFLTPKSVLELFQDLARPPPANVTKLDKKIQRVLGKAVLDTAFVPTVGGGKVKPADARTWAHDLPSVLNQKAAAVRGARLGAPAVMEAFPALRSFGAEPLAAIDYAKILNHAACRDRESCMRAAQVARQACFSGVFTPSSVLNALAGAPFWLTHKGRVRSLSGDRPLVRLRPEMWPGWLAADDLDKEFATAVLGKGQSVDQPWTSLVNGRLLQTHDDLIVHCLVPTLKGWSDKAWSKWGWEALATVHAWRTDWDWTKIKPHVQGKSPDPDPTRTALVTVARVPRGRDWVLASEAYASAEINGDSALADFFRHVPCRSVVGMPPKAKSFGRAGWRALLRYLGVSWEPKILPFRSQHAWGSDDLPCFWRFWSAIADRGLNWRRRDWYLDGFPECVEGVSSRSLVRMLADVLSASSKLEAAYTKRSDASRTHKPSPFSSCIDYQLRRECYLHCRPSLAHPEFRGVASELFWPDRGLRGITPILDFGALPVSQRQRLRTLFVQHLGVQEDLPSQWGPWLTWADQIASAVDERQGDLKERVVRDFYELFLRRTFIVPRPRPVKRVVCMTSDGVKALPSGEVIWIDDPKFAAPEVQEALLDAGLALFPAMLKRGEGSVARLGTQPATSVVKVTPNYAVAGEGETSRLVSRLAARRRAFAAVCEAKLEQWRDPGPIIAVHDLTLAFEIDDKVIETRAAPAFHGERGWLVNLGAGRWEALAVVLADPFRHAADLRHWFAAILKASNSAEVAAILREGGIPTYRLKEIALPDDAPADELDEQGATQGNANRTTGISNPGDGAKTEGMVAPTGPSEQVDSPAQLAGDSAGRSTSTPEGQREAIGDEERSSDDVVLRKRPLFDTNRRRPTQQAGGSGRASAATAATRASARGLAAEAWLAERLRETIPQGWFPEFNIRDDEVRESDVVLSSKDDEWHIEIKAVTETRIYWSQLEQQKAEAHPGRYLMAFLMPKGSSDYRIHWSWDPLTDLLVCERRLDWIWAGAEPGPRLPPNSWEPLAGLKRPERPANRMNFVIELRSEVLDALPRDNRALSKLWTRITSPSPRKRIAAE